MASIVLAAGVLTYEKYATHIYTPLPFRFLSLQESLVNPSPQNQVLPRQTRRAAPLPQRRPLRGARARQRRPHRAFTATHLLLRAERLGGRGRVSGAWLYPGAGECGAARRGRGRKREEQ